MIADRDLDMGSGEDPPSQSNARREGTKRSPATIRSAVSWEQP